MWSEKIIRSWVDTVACCMPNMRLVYAVEPHCRWESGFLGVHAAVSMILMCASRGLLWNAHPPKVSTQWLYGPSKFWDGAIKKKC